MPGEIASELRKKTDAAFDNMIRQLEGMEPHMERSDAPGEWTTREVLSHLLFAPGWDPVALLKTFAARNLPVVDVEPGNPHLTDERKKMPVKQFVDTLATQRRSVFGYLETLSDADLEQRKATIPLFKRVMGTDEIPMAHYIGALFDHHWNDHAGQLAKIRKSAGLSVV